MPRSPRSRAFDDFVSLLRDEMHSTERVVIWFSVFRFDELSTREKELLCDFSNRYRALVQELCALDRGEGL